MDTEEKEEDCKETYYNYTYQCRTWEITEEEIEAIKNGWVPAKDMFG